MDTNTLIRMLEPPKNCVDVVIDTDAYNEIDDQFAISYALRSTDKMTVKAIYAAPFLNPRSESPADGMEKSYQEILKLLKLAEREDMTENTFRGSDMFLTDENTPVDSDAARDLAARAKNYTSENPLYVIALGAITNVASALLMAPEIIDRIVIVWLGGHAWHWAHNREFNLKQEEVAERVAKSRTAVTNSMRLLKLDERVQQMVIDEMISTGHARALLAIENSDLQFQTANKIFNEKLSVRDVEKLVKNIGKEKLVKKEEDEQQKAVYADLEEKMKASLGTKVSINRKNDQKGKIEIEYYSIEELERLMEILMR